MSCVATPEPNPTCRASVDAMAEEQSEFTDEERAAYRSPCPECGQERDVEWVHAVTFGKSVWVKGLETCRNPECPKSPGYRSNL